MFNKLRQNLKEFNEELNKVVNGKRYEGYTLTCQKCGCQGQAYEVWDMEDGKEIN